jgi:phosphatidylserine/phosphatidylglycerophosphate/cardiolipin synthase-like enzyme
MRIKKLWLFFILTTISILITAQAQRAPTLIARADGTILQAFFTPFDNVRQLLVDIINKEQASIKIASYFITDPAVAHALIKAHERNVVITAIADYSMLSSNQHSKVLYELAQAIDLYIFRHMDRGLMHNKFVIFEKNDGGQSLVWTGSYNLTRSAQNYNFENVVVSNDRALIEQYRTIYPQLLEQAIAAQSIFNVLNFYQTPSNTKVIILPLKSLRKCAFARPITTMLRALGEC